MQILSFQSDSFWKDISLLDNVGQRSDCTFSAVLALSTMSAGGPLVTLSCFDCFPNDQF